MILELWLSSAVILGVAVPEFPLVTSDDEIEGHSFNDIHPKHRIQITVHHGLAHYRSPNPASNDRDLYEKLSWKSHTIVVEPQVVGW